MNEEEFLVTAHIRHNAYTMIGHQGRAIERDGDIIRRGYLLSGAVGGDSWHPFGGYMALHSSLTVAAGV